MPNSVCLSLYNFKLSVIAVFLIQLSGAFCALTTGTSLLSYFAKPLLSFSTAFGSIYLLSLKSPEALLKIVAPSLQAIKYLGSVIEPSLPNATPSCLTASQASLSFNDVINTTLAPFCIAFFNLVIDLPLSFWLSKTNSNNLPSALSPFDSAQKLVRANSSTALPALDKPTVVTFIPAFTKLGTSLLTFLQIVPTGS